MKAKLLMLLMIVCHQAFGQRIYSDCSDNTNQDGLKYFENDVDQLLMRNIEKYDPQYLDYIAEIKRDSFQYLLRKLMAIRNATSQPYNGLIFNTLQLHTSSDIPMRNVNIVADSTLYWMVNLKNGNHFSGNREIDTLIKYYGLSHFYSRWISNTGVVFFKSDRNISARALAYYFDQIDGVSSFLFNENVGSSKNIEVNKLNDSADNITFSYSWGDCPSGCIWSVKWQFVVYNDCSFEYMGLSGDVDLFKQSVNTSRFLKDSWSVYPNPFTNLLQLNGLAEDVTFSMFDIRGCKIFSGKTENARIDDLDFINAGIYFLEIDVNGQVRRTMIVK